MNGLIKQQTPIPGPATKTPEWYENRFYDPQRTERPVIFGASEAAAALNVTKHGSALELYLQKRREMPVADYSANEAVQAGNYLEPAVLAWYSDRSKLEEVGCELVLEPTSYFHPVHAFMSATPDAIVQRSSDGEWLKSVDAKCSTFRRWDEFGLSEDKFGVEGTDQVPLDYMCQAQQQMAVLGVVVVDFPVLLDGRHLKIYTVRRSDELIAKIVAAEAELAERIRDGRPPEPNWSLPGAPELIRELYGLESGQVTSLDESDAEAWTDYMALGLKIKEMETRRDEIKAQLLWKIGSAEIGRFPSGDVELRRCVVAASYWSQEDVREIQDKIGQIKRKGHERLLARKVK